MKWFDVARGYGFVIPDNGMPDVLLHLSCLKRDGYEAKFIDIRTSFGATTTMLLDYLVRADVPISELGVLQGGARLLSEQRPVILCEVGKDSRDAVTKLLVDQRYALYDMKIQRDQRHELERAVWNTIAVPETTPEG